MNYFAQILILISTLTLWMPAVARSSDIYGPTPVVLSDDQSQCALGQHMETIVKPNLCTAIWLIDLEVTAHGSRKYPEHDQQQVFQRIFIAKI